MTVDEFVHLPVGLYMARTGDFRPDPINPPLSRMLPAIAWAIDPSVPTPTFNPNPWGMGLAFMDANASTYQAIFVRSRGVVIAISALLGWLLAHWAGCLYGPAASLVALLLFAFSPSFLAHGHLVTVDVAGSLGFALALFALWRLVAAPAAWRSVTAGGTLGLAILLKLSSLILAPIFASVLIARWLRAASNGRPDAARWLRWLLMITAVSTLTIDAGYGFDGVLRRLDALDLRPAGKLVALGRAAPWLRLPLPEPFLRGIDLTMTGDDPATAQYYLAGKFSRTGWWYYHLVAFVVKTPLPMVLLSTAAVLGWPLRRRSLPGEGFVMLGIVTIFAANALLNPLDFGVRHVLPAEALLCVAVSPLLARPLQAWLRGTRGMREHVDAIAAVAAMVWIVSGTARLAPRYLEYFNEAAGGPENGHRWLIDSNLDWGQDLLRLSDFMRERGLASVPLAYFGTVHPLVYGIRFTPLTPDTHGPAVISATTLMGSTYAAWLAADRHERPAPDEFAWLRARTPAGRIGSMMQFDLP